MEKIRVAVLMGGPSSEHEVSLKTGEQIIANLDKNKFEVLPVKIFKNGAWPLTIAELKEKSDIVFVALHGEYGEDGQVQGILETFGISYTGSDPVASALAMDKRKTNLLFSQNDFSVPESISFCRQDSEIDWPATDKFGLPLVIKPVNRGSSVGVTILDNLSALNKAVNCALKYSDLVMFQRYVRGREFACGVLEINKVTVPLLPTEIIPKRGKFFDFASKYEVGGSEEITPPDLPREIIKKIQVRALRAHRLVGCSGMSRSDFILGEDGQLHILEINTIPGMTETSLLPQEAKALGIDFPRLLEFIVKAGLNRVSQSHE